MPFVFYGLQEVPEGNFYCDRCQAVQWFATECDEWCYYFSKTAVMCALCPLFHGGLKPTTDGRWVHMCCAVWSGNAVIQDLNEMSPIDISRVPVVLKDAPLASSVKICIFCGLASGYISPCCGGEVPGSCPVHFHHLCAWFNGMYLGTTVTDPSFQAGTIKIFLHYITF